MAFDSKKFLVRTGSAAVFVIVLLGCILWNYYSFSALFFIVSLWGLHEFYKLMEVNGNKPNRMMGFLSAIALNLYGFGSKLMAFFIFSEIDLDEKVKNLFIYLCIFFVFMTFIIELFKNNPNPFNNISATIIGLIYVVLPFVLLNLTSSMNLGSRLFCFGPTYYSQFILAIFLLIWSNDTFAYLVGSFIGKNKMYERISPGKTWEGTIGGAILTVASSFLIYKWFGILQLYDWIIISVIVAVFGTLGDLVESMLKRSVGVKDSGNIMPGHGGILDRFDSLIMVAPFVFLYLILK